MRDHENLGRRGWFDCRLPGGFPRLRLALDRFPPVEGISLFVWAERRWYSALLGPWAATI
jgi:hypothetical protein